MEMFGLGWCFSAPVYKTGSRNYFSLIRVYLRSYKVKHYGHQGETHLQLLRLNGRWVFTTRHVSQGVENVTCKAHRGACTEVKNHRDLGTTGHCENADGIANVLDRQIKVGRSHAILLTNIEIITKCYVLWGQSA